MRINVEKKVHIFMFIIPNIVVKKCESVKISLLGRIEQFIVYFLLKYKGKCTIKQIIKEIKGSKITDRSVYRAITSLEKKDIQQRQHYLLKYRYEIYVGKQTNKNIGGEF